MRLVREALGGAIRQYQQTPGSLVGSSIAATMKPTELRRLDRGLQSAMLSVDAFCFERVDDEGEDAEKNLRAVDRCNPEEIVVAYADANRIGGYSTATVWRKSIVDAFTSAKALTSAQRRRRLNDLVAAALNHEKKAENSDERQVQLQAIQDAVIEIAGLTIDEANFGELDRAPPMMPPLFVVLVKSGSDRKLRIVRTFVRAIPVAGLGRVSTAGSA